MCARLLRHTPLKRRVLVLSLDGTPHSLLRERMSMRPGSPWHELTSVSTLHRIRSSRPEVSSVAWASYLTGSAPEQHGIFGFVDRTLNPFQLYYPNGLHLRMPTVFERVHDAGGSVVSLNVPATSPAKALRGVVVGGFLVPRLEGNVHPPHLVRELQDAGYVVDVDPALAYSDRKAFYDSLLHAHRARVAAGLRFVEEVEWDLFHLHLMETDRLFHFFWGEADWAERFHQFLDFVDEAVTQFAQIARRKGASLVLLSDHGFTRSRRVLFVNAFLKLAGLLSFEKGRAPSLATLHPSSRAYALAPGRIFLNLRGREPLGSVSPGHEAERELEKISQLLRDLKDPQTGEALIEELVRPGLTDTGHLRGMQADLLAFGREGVDLKADFDAERMLSTPKVLVGTHTYRDAFFLVADGDSPEWAQDEGDISAAGRHVARLLGLPPMDFSGI